jgi:hypothetical protein
MKLEAKTVEILSNFCSISPSMLFKEGNVLSTVSPNKTVLAKATVPNNFPKKFAIYDLSRLLGAVSHAKGGELSFEDNNYYVRNTELNSEFKLNYTPENNIKVPPEKGITLPSVDVTFKLKSSILKDVIKGGGSQALPEVAFFGNGSDILLQAFDVKDPSSSHYSVKVGTTDKNFRIVFKIENITKILDGEYNVSISSKGISYFKGDNIEYWIAVETTSTYGG